MTTQFAIACSLTFVASCAATAPHSSPQEQKAEVRQSIEVLLGERGLSSDWEPVDDQLAIGFTYSSEDPNKAVGWEAGLMFSGDDAVAGPFDVDGSTTELFGGVRKSFGSGGALRPYVGAGLAVISGDFEVSSGASSVSDDDSSPALYVHGGLGWDVSESISLGIDLRILTGSDITLFNVDSDADYVQLGFFIGFGF